MLLFGAIFLLYETILAIPSVQYLIVDILNEDLTLTGRTYIYTRMLDLMDTQPCLVMGMELLHFLQRITSMRS